MYLRIFLPSLLVTVGLGVREGQVEDTTHMGRVSIYWVIFPFLNLGSPSGADLMCSGFYFDPRDSSVAYGIPSESLCQTVHHLESPGKMSRFIGNASICYLQICEDWVLECLVTGTLEV